MTASSRGTQQVSREAQRRDYSTQSRTERLIAGARVILSIAALVTLWFDPTQPPRYAIAYDFLGAYIVYSIALAALAWRTYMPSRWGVIVIHGVDLIVISILIALFEGPLISPFFVFFVFSLLSATLRWNWKGCLWTAGCALAAFTALGLYEGEFVFDEIVYLGVVAVLLAYMGAYEQQRRGQISALGAWPPGVAADLATVVREAIEYAASILNTPRVVFVLEEVEEPGCRLAYLTGQVFELTREPTLSVQSVVAPGLRDGVFLCPDARTGQGIILMGDTREAIRWSRGSVDVHLQARFSMVSVLSVPLVGDGWMGRLFFLDTGRTTVDDLSLARVVGQQVVARLDRHYLLQQLQQAAIIQERMGLGRDLHDGLLQSLTGMALQVHSALRLLRETPHAAEVRLLTVQEQILAVQQSLRNFIRNLKREAPDDVTTGPDLRRGLRDVCESVERQWRGRVVLQVNGAEATLPTILVRDVLHIAHEALANSARHGGASQVTLDVQVTETDVRMLVVDDGRGFPFTGQYGLDELVRLKRGPASIKERILERRGQLVLTSSGTGARLDITIPREGAGEPYFGSSSETGRKLNS